MPMIRALWATALLLMATVAAADEAAIRKNLTERLPNFPPIDEVSKTPIPGIYELRVGAEIFYSDEQGQYVLQGSLIDTKSRVNLTEARIAKLTQIDFASLPLKDAVLIKQGSGTRKLVVFGDPNCGYCKRLERDLVTLKDVSIYTFIFPILGPDSNVKARDIWCAKEPGKVWRNWMVDGTTPPKLLGDCATPLDRNLELSRKHRVSGTPAIVFENGVRVPGMLTADQLEQQLASNSKG